ncbi:7-cyano-7-deazaguanine synthase [Bosea sp. 685]|uniref:7-cyano-7-deazaguanine synthase n=1 Tax=Bosea sp. 685 TaxID=3080057 RepID=UPI002892F5B5|nr:7-cyano-7-deazaguanine synthase [Bosea sp. 685]WNJ90919.1 7-cyano-7-deazaguanine synthase [Bosea sp. 685]
MKALLMSGGLDSSALAWWLRPDLCVTVNYGQQAAKGEMAASTAICNAIGLAHQKIEVDLSSLGSGTMADKAPAAGGSAAEFWPYRNQMLVTLAAMLLMPQGVKEIMVGSVSTDRHTDGKAIFYRALDRTVSLQEGSLRVTAPARKYSTPKLLKMSGFPYDLIGLTFSCHVYEYACGQCSGCIKHRQCVEDAYGASPGGAV